jgi:demethylmenaquinone methyltransferase/2-methoxy-6-polyprenyl-1,4-benzoquinol methylase
MTTELKTPETSWDAALLSNPHQVADKRDRVQRMFAAIAPSYDINNRLHSLWMDQSWRRRAVKLAQVRPGDVVADIACGTGDLAIKFRDAAEGPQRVIGIDFTLEMLPIAIRKSNSDQSDRPMLFINGDAQSIPMSDASADVVSIAFGIRNVADPATAIREFHRILRPGGRLVILEFSLPTNAPLRAIYNFYFYKILPRTATWISGDRTGAYKYLPRSVNTFIGRSEMCRMMEDGGFSDVSQHSMTFGICVCYRGVKK